MARRAATMIPPNSYINLGIGIPILIANFIDPSLNVYFHSENGFLGIGRYPMPGEEDPDMINAGKETVTLRPGGCSLSSVQAFAMIRGGHIDMSFLGGL